MQNPFFRFNFLLFSIMLCGNTAFSQSTVKTGGKKINVRNADELKFDGSVPDAQRLIGNVEFEHEGTLMYCDSAYFYDVGNRMEAFSNIRIIGDSVTVTGNRLNYDGSTRLADIIGNVSMVDPTTILTTDRLQYDLAKKLASYSTGGKIVSRKNKNELTSMFGQYNSNTKLFYFRKNVKLVNPDYVMICDTLQYNTSSETAYFFGPTTITSKENIIYCENGYYNTETDISQFEKNAKITSKGQDITADQIWYDRKSGLGKARKKVAIRDSAEKIILRGNYADYFEKTDRILITDSALMVKEFGKDTLFLHGDTLRSVTDTSVDKRTLYAFHHVKFFKNDFQGKCDSLVYTEPDSMMRLFGRPVLWNNENQLTGDTVYLQLANNEIETLYLRNAAFIVSEEDTMRFNQIKGKNITGHFTESELRKINVNGHGQSIYYSKDEKNEYIGVNKADCTDMVIYIDSSEVQKITFITKPVATLYPVNELPKEELKLVGFKWFEELRPIDRYDLFRWKEIVVTEPEKRKRIKN